MKKTFRRQCPQCDAWVTWPAVSTYPFCPERCRLIDLGQRAEGQYRIPGAHVVDDKGLVEPLFPDAEEIF